MSKCLLLAQIAGFHHVFVLLTNKDNVDVVSSRWALCRVLVGICKHDVRRISYKTLDLAQHVIVAGSSQLHATEECCVRLISTQLDRGIYP
jgi:hypothetical protein